MVEGRYSNLTESIAMERQQMKNIYQTLLEAIQHIVKQHPDIAPNVEQIAANAQGKNLEVANCIMALNQELLAKSKSQLRQDIFVLYELKFKRNGFFIEFGAANGVDLSNTHLLEKEFDWSGILAEPAKLWQPSLSENRRAKIETKCVWKTTGETLLFNETNQPEYSTLHTFSSNDHLSTERENGNAYSVETISLMDLLQKHNAPQEIDYLSIDTEGSEFEILEHFDFNKYNIRVITCEHNFTPIREKLFSLLTEHGYIRKFEQISQWDDWYVKT